ncbi:MAG: hypothetical protein CMB80_00215 [Flammeovirgaceae bacterium]|nr:hypothetical protein [Flammeovirgaceae bacterium]|tara:strand:- start:1556 stop:1816 length:261 start_codon:yes stop_codon:yes gene_type:complete
MKEIKSGEKKIDKAISDVTREIRKLQPAVKMTTGSKTTSDLTDGEFVFSSVDKDSQSPGSPATDEGRMYFRMNGVLYELTGTKVGG